MKGDRDDKSITCGRKLVELNNVPVLVHRICILPSFTINIVCVILKMEEGCEPSPFRLAYQLVNDQK